MTSEAQHIAALLIRHWQGEISPEEASELRVWAGDDLQRKHLLESFSSPDHAAHLLAKWQAHDKSSIAARLQREFPELQLSNTVAVENALQPPVHRVHFLISPKAKAWIRYAAAIIILFGIGAYLWNQNLKVKTENSKKEHVFAADVQPGGNKAVLTLSDGQRVILDSAASATIHDGTLSIENNDGQLIYFEKGGKGDFKKGDKVAMNTMSTPKGGQYQLTLADGTKVWLNAASSITYPISFTEKTRTVSITGEAYFEVSQNAKQPFVVKTQKEDITVLGTSFNVNAYADEPAVKTSLLEGSVKIGNMVLKPGQAYLNGEIARTNIRQDIAWKNGAFDFNNLTLEQAARQIERWYDVEIRFTGPVPRVEIYGGVSRAVTLQALLKGMEGEFAHFDLQGKVLYIKSL